VDVGALCLSSWQADSVGFREAEESYPDEDKHKAPTSTRPHPLSLQDGDALLLLQVVKRYQDEGDSPSPYKKQLVQRPLPSSVRLGKRWRQMSMA